MLPLQRKARLTVNKIPHSVKFFSRFMVMRGG